MGLQYRNDFFLNYLLKYKFDKIINVIRTTTNAYNNFSRVDSEQLYAKSLSKMATKLNKACREIPGTIADAWRGVANEMETRSEVHRQFSNSLIEEIVKPLKSVLETQHKSRKSVSIPFLRFQFKFLNQDGYFLKNTNR